MRAYEMFTALREQVAILIAGEMGKTLDEARADTPIAIFTSEDEVVALANDTQHGLASCVFTSDVERSFRLPERLEAGMVGVNQGWCPTRRRLSAESKALGSVVTAALRASTNISTSIMSPSRGVEQLTRLRNRQETAMSRFDVVVIGGGIAGVSLGYHLAAQRAVCVLDMESSLGFHTTGRSAATYVQTYGGRTIRLLTTASRQFLQEPPDGFDGPLMSPRPLLWAASIDAVGQLDAFENTIREFNSGLHRVDAAEALQACPILNREWIGGGLIDESAAILDVHALQQGYSRGLRNRNGTITAGANVASIERRPRCWSITTTNGEVYECATLVNAAGAWGDAVAELAGVPPAGLQPMLRNLFQVPMPASVDTTALPMVDDISENFYFLPERTSLLCSPADEVPSAPCDAKPMMENISRALDTIREATTVDPRHVSATWAGLRTFTADGAPIASYDTDVEDFFWFVGQGGYGIQTAPALSETAAAIFDGRSLPSSVVKRGLTASDLGRHRVDATPG